MSFAKADNKSQYFAINKFNNKIVSSFNHCSFDQLNMPNHSLPAQGTNPPFSHKSVVSTTHEENIICTKTLICRQLFAGHIVSSQPMKRKEKIHRMIIIIIIIIMIMLLLLLLLLLLFSGIVMLETIRNVIDPHSFRATLVVTNSSLNEDLNPHLCDARALLNQMIKEVRMGFPVQT